MSVRLCACGLVVGTWESTSDCLLIIMDVLLFALRLCICARQFVLYLYIHTDRCADEIERICRFIVVFVVYVFAYISAMC